MYTPAESDEFEDSSDGNKESKSRGQKPPRGTRGRATRGSRGSRGRPRGSRGRPRGISKPPRGSRGPRRGTPIRETSPRATRFATPERASQASVPSGFVTPASTPAASARDAEEASAQATSVASSSQAYRSAPSPPNSTPRASASIVSQKNPRKTTQFPVLQAPAVQPCQCRDCLSQSSGEAPAHQAITYPSQGAPPEPTSQASVPQAQCGECCLIRSLGFGDSCEAHTQISTQPSQGVLNQAATQTRWVTRPLLPDRPSISPLTPDRPLR